MEPEPVKEVSPLDEAKQIKEDLTKLRDEIKAERQKIEGIHANAVISGRSLLGNQVDKTDKEKADDEAREIIKTFYGK